MSFPGYENSTTKFLRADGVFAEVTSTTPPGAPVDAQYVVLALNGTLTNERRLVVGSPITLVDAGANSTVTLDFDETVTLGNNARVAVSKNSGATVGTRRRINLIEGSNVTLTVSDDAGNEEVDVTIASAASGAPTNATYVVITNDATLTNERALAVGSPLTLSDGGANGSVTLDFDETVALGNNARVAVRKNSTGSVSTRRRLNFIEGTGATITVTDDGGNEEVDITIASAGGNDPRLQTVVLNGDVSDNSGALTNVTGFFVTLEPDKVYVVRALVRFKTDDTAAGVAFALRGPNPGSGEARTQDVHTMVPTTAAVIVDRITNVVNETGTLTTSNTIAAANTVYLAELSALVVACDSGDGGDGQYFLAFHGDGAAIATVMAGSAMYAIEMGTL